MANPFDEDVLSVAELYEDIMDTLSGQNPGEALAALTMALKDLALTHHGEPDAARRRSTVALSKAFDMGSEPQNKTVH